MATVIIHASSTFVKDRQSNEAGPSVKAARLSGLTGTHVIYFRFRIGFSIAYNSSSTWLIFSRMTALASAIALLYI